MEKNFEYKIKLKGLNCANCAAKIEDKTRKLKGVATAEFNLSNQIFTLGLEENLDRDKLIKNVKEIVDETEPGVETLSMDEEFQTENSYAEIIKSAFVFLGLILNISVEHKYKFFVFLLLYLVAGYEVIFSALKKIKTGDFLDEEFLMSIASIGAFVIGEYPEGIAVMLFYSVGEFFQDRAVDKSRDSIQSALKLKPEYANIESNGELVRVSPSDISIGDVIVVKPGEKIPLDGEVIEGSSNLDTSMISGESLPRFVDVGDNVVSGCLNTTSLLKIRVHSTYENTTIAKIVDMVENASSRKSDTERLITRFSRIYTPIVVGIAILMALSPIVGILEWKDALFRACTFLVVSCPCAFVLSVPLGVFAGIGAASKEGIFVKGGNYLEALANINQLFFDKTGTLTKGMFTVTKVVSKKGTEEDILKLAYSAERNSNHPIARAIVSAYSGKAVEVEELREIAGQGIEYTYDNKRVLVGSDKLLNRYGGNLSANENGVVVYVAEDDEVLGYLVVEDTLKNGVADDLQKLNAQGINLTLLSGDKIENVREVANELGIDNFYGELLPADKVRLLEENMNSSGKVAFVGDGVNDAPVLARADIGIAMGSIGSDIAIESADVVLMTDEISKIIKGMKISKKTNSIVKQNITFALLVKFAVLILGFFGVASMWAAVFADVGVTIIAIFNSMRALNS
ncbi:Cd2+/Zn2+-exporting ATPase [Peptoniphilus asaccharolyticus DSM 20463]|uniref:Cd(2+)-exporting ATPase n=1 Tax=Peptoniphilus asaccharolyticus DSM 20463 TaxID=573058 RepID=A0A1W1V0T8_PEPAS|nr:heavy metal translocating P-type ATPase [Peptoniphilus asaccharolyticus]MBL7575422.1 cadmium-translocating P-type ATPase [Peptoniphilus asaccharolyticus]SMB86634.1 Cd2+/Zn2+-exporting ATPase [Peptoniphilus asaccharolyticus DSM 20463]